MMRLVLHMVLTVDTLDSILHQMPRDFDMKNGMEMECLQVIFHTVHNILIPDRIMDTRVSTSRHTVCTHSILIPDQILDSRVITSRLVEILISRVPDIVLVSVSKICRM